jgi:hypothetical protein
MLVLATVVQGDQASVGLRDVTTIENGSGAARVLFRANELPDLGSVAINRAILTLPWSGERVNRTIPLQLSAVSQDWSAGSVAWNTGWLTPGGDVYDQLYSRLEVNCSEGRTSLRFDVTNILKEDLEAGVPIHGFLLSLQPRYGVGLQVPDLARLQGLETGTLEISYRTIPRRPERLRAEPEAAPRPRRAAAEQ